MVVTARQPSVGRERESLTGGLYVRQRLFSSVVGLLSGSASSPVKGLHSLADFRTRGHRRWNFKISAVSPMGNFDLDLRAIDAPIVGYPDTLSGDVRSEGETVASIEAYSCRPRESRLLTVTSRERRISIRCNRAKKVFSGSWDVVFAEDSLGELASIKHIHGACTLREQFTHWMGSPAFVRRGEFGEAAGAARIDALLGICFLASLCAYFGVVEWIYNTDHGG